MNQIFIISITVSALWQKNVKFWESSTYLENTTISVQGCIQENVLVIPCFWTMLIKSIRTVAALIDVNFHVITKNTCRLQILTNIPDVSRKPDV